MICARKSRSIRSSNCCCLRACSRAAHHPLHAQNTLRVTVTVLSRCMRRRTVGEIGIGQIERGSSEDRHPLREAESRFLLRHNGRADVILGALRLLRQRQDGLAQAAPEIEGRCQAHRTRQAGDVVAAAFEVHGVGVVLAVELAGIEHALPLLSQALQ
ncbi:hypothetical protein LP419_16170 [Massilia sp. H-1]|nr:hypothetical protein LP419_16170 [Massilia sp. H-1]